MRKQTWLLIVAAAALAFSMSGCKSSKTAETVSSEVVTSEEAGVSETGTVERDGAEQNNQVRTMIDSAGREVKIPVKITKIAPSGPLAQIVLYTVSPDQLAGRASDFSDEAKQYIDEKYWGLPKFGQFYGKNASLNMEALILEAPDVIIDIGEAKKTVKEDMDALQEQLGIPVLFVEATLPTMEQAYTLLGEITGETKKAGELAAYCKKVMDMADEISSSISAEDKKSVYFAGGAGGLNTNAKGSIHADVIEKIGAVNAADVDLVSSGGGSEVSFEQILLWQPDIIIADKQELYDVLTTDVMWQELKAVKEGKVYKIPTAPYSFMSSPPSVNRIIGIQWLGQLVYPEKYTMDIKDAVAEFYQLFYHIDLTDEQIADILKNSITE